MMRLLNERGQIEYAMENWPRMYGARNPSMVKPLSEIDPKTATAKDLAEIVGNNAWAYPMYCGECGTETWGIVEIGEPSGYEGWTARVCRGCLEKAIKMLDEAK